MKVRLTDKIVSSYKWDGHETIVRDLELKGFFLSIGKSKKSFKIQVDVNVDGRRKTVRRTIGTFENTSVSVARNVAKNLIYQIRNPSEDLSKKPDLNSFSDAARILILQKYNENS
ncbi:hypothetical protein SAMN04487859_119112 [Roseovarius lutimaris]|uniref:Integrase DNA-binding domain-containing protein n=1 Tax=Roseovarius lutimaris TaxID=1005928 RepID=A0A1I5FFI2_9RHOB|nr:Arm DNA-binding domain-containing protein [Roseovarius lutimaris]SFO22346.1 hypothetical protein SAMN04487859_119112 [Roseovarius lutimaris]